MGTELNLTDDQRRRIEDAKSAEEKVAIIMEAVDTGRGLSDEQLEAVSGGNVRYFPKTHEAIDHAWDVIQALSDTYGIDAAVLAAYDMGLIPREADQNGNYFTNVMSIPDCRAMMHDDLNGRDTTSSW